MPSFLIVVPLPQDRSDLPQRLRTTPCFPEGRNAVERRALGARVRTSSARAFVSAA